MSRCRESRHVQSYLDGDLAPERARAFETHLAGCDGCAAELEAYRSLFTALGSSRERILALDPGPALTERILDRVLPSRLRRRWVAAAGWLYGAVSAVGTFLFVSWIARPDTPVWLAQRFSEGSLRVIQSTLFAFQLITRSWLELTQGWGLIERMAERLLPFVRALARPLADPMVAAVSVAALLACVLLLRWMRSGRRAAKEEIRHVGLLGF